MTDGVERRSHFRGRPRVGRRVSLRFRVAGDPSAASEATTHDIGVGGAFISTDRTQPVGARLELDIDVTGQAGPISLLAEVRWVIEAGTPGAREPGMGVKFGALEVDALLALSDFFAQLAGGTGDPLAG